MAGSLSRALVAFAGVGAVVGVACTDGRPRSAPSVGDGVGRTQQSVLGTEYQFTGDDLGDKELILTFDDGPSQKDASTNAWQTRRISTYLKNLGIRTTFFLIGGCAKALTGALRTEEINAESGCDDPNDGALDTINAVLADGHLIGNHSGTHRNLTGASDWQNDLLFTDALLANYPIPYDRLYFRAPQGEWTSSYSNGSKTPGNPLYKYKGPVYWNAGGGPTTYGNDTSMAADWECWQGKDGGGTKQLSTNQCATRYLNEIRAVRKGIVLMHDAAYGNTEATSDDAVPGNSFRMLQIIMNSLMAEGGWKFRSLWDDPALASAHPKCDASCASCDGETASRCLSCASGAYLSAGRCLTCTAACAAGSFQTSACTTTADTACQSCTSCTAGTFQTSACTTTSDAACTTCSPCAAGRHVVTACTATADTVCVADEPTLDAGTTDAREDGGAPTSAAIGDAGGGNTSASPGTSADAGAGGTGDAPTSSSGGCSASPTATGTLPAFGLVALGLLLQRRRRASRLRA